jgi:hypothetical protein
MNTVESSFAEQSFAERVAHFTRLVEEFRYAEAHELFYDENLVKHENENAPVIGLAQHNREMEHFLSSITNASAKPLQTLLGENISVVEWEYQFDHQDWGHRHFRQLSVQRWKKGRIVHERHHYSTAS